MKLNRTYLLLLVLIFQVPYTITAQDESSCNPEISDKKTRKLYEKGIDRKKYDKAERMNYLRELIEIEPDFAEAYYILGTEAIRTAKYQGSSYLPAEKYFLQLIALCPDFHSDPYYYLGNISLGKKDYGNTVKYFKAFLNFQSDDDDKFARDFEDKYEEVKESFQWVKFFRDQFANPVPYLPEIVKDISTTADEYLPLISPDNMLLFFTRRSEKKAPVVNSFSKSDQVTLIERFSAGRWKNGKFPVGEPLPEPFNQSENHNYGGASISLDNKQLFLTVCKPAKMGYINCDIYSSEHVYSYNERSGKKEWHWTELRNPGPNVNTEDGWEAQPSLSADGKTLYFASAREGSQGIDIYKSEKDSAGEWGAASNLGPPINTIYNDKSPFMHSDSRTLYFASQGHIGFGGFDVFYAKIDDNDNWQQPVNIGHPINTEEDEHGFVVSTDGKTVYFASDKQEGKSGKLNIFSFELYKDARPEKVRFVKGEVKDDAGRICTNARLEIKNTVTNKIMEFAVDSIDGSYAAIITHPDSQDVVVNVKADGKVFNSHLFQASDTGDTYRTMNLQLETMEIGKPFKLDDIYYATNSAEIKASSKYILNEFILFLKENPRLNVAIYGHTDNIGKKENNLVLSTDRAFSVMDYLQKHGIEKSRLSFKGFGESKPIAPNTTPEGRALNRRTEFVILSK